MFGANREGSHGVSSKPEAEKKSEAAPAEGAAAGGEAKKGSKLPIIIAAIMIVEGAGVYFLVSMLGHKPADAEAHQVEGGGEAALANSQVEIPLIEDKFQNMSTNNVWLWDASIVLKVKKKHEPEITTLLEERNAEIKEGVAMIFRKATHNQLREPGLETLNRQLTAFVGKIVGNDHEGNPIIERVLIPKCRGFQAD